MAVTALLKRIEAISPGRRIAIWALTLGMMAGAFLWLYYLPAREEVARLREEVRFAEQRLQQARMRAANLAKFEAEGGESEAQFQKALKLLPNQREIPALLKSITQLGSDSGLEFLLFSPKAERNQDFYAEIPVAVELSGAYHDVARFFDQVGRMERIVTVLDVSMRPVEPLSTRLITRCDLVTYRFKEPGDEAAQESRK